MKYSKQTLQKIADFEANGYTIIYGNNPYLSQRAKWRDHYECVRLAQTNSRYHGKSISTVWAVKPLAASWAATVYDKEVASLLTTKKNAIKPTRRTINTKKKKVTPIIKKTRSHRFLDELRYSVYLNKSGKWIEQARFMTADKAKSYARATHKAFGGFWMVEKR